MKYSVIGLTLGALLAGCNLDSKPSKATTRMNVSESSSEPSTAAATTSSSEEKLGVATFAGGCFWCMEKPFEKLPGVLSAVSGYTGGETEAPTYQAVCTGSTGHTEAIRIEFDPEMIDYSSLLDVFWRQIDPTDAGGQFVDRGSQYRSAIFYHNERQHELALASKKALEESGRFTKPIVTEILPVSAYYEAEEYHQDYYEKNSSKYERYRKGSGRDSTLDKLWGEDREVKVEPMQPMQSTESPQDNDSAGRTYSKPSDAELRERLTDLQYRVTQEADTERAFQNEYWDNHGDGIYVDIVTGEPLFSSLDKYDSGCGWPSFTQPLAVAKITSQTDYKLGYGRTEVRSGYGDSHLGHVFKDGPKPTGLRYCINSASLRFVPVAELEKEGLGEYVKTFKK